MDFDRQHSMKTVWKVLMSQFILRKGVSSAAVFVVLDTVSEEAQLVKRSQIYEYS